MPRIICPADNAHAAPRTARKNTRHCPARLADHVKRTDRATRPTRKAQIYPVPHRPPAPQQPAHRPMPLPPAVPDAWNDAPLHDQIDRVHQLGRIRAAQRMNPPIDALREMGQMRPRNFIFPRRASVNPNDLLTHADELVNQGLYTSALELYNTAAIHFSYDGNREMQRRAEQMAESCRIQLLEEI